jgi:hypothetical protein
MPVLEPDPPVAAAAALDWLTLAEAKQALNIDAAVTTFDAEVASYVTAVSQRLDELTGAMVYRTITDETHHGGLASVTLNYRPVVSISAISEYAYTTQTTLTAETNATKPTSGYLLDANWGVLYRRSGGGDSLFPTGMGNVVVTYVAGRYATTALVDPKYKQAAATFLAHLWRLEQGSGSATFGGVSETTSGLSPGFGFAIPNRVMELVAEDLAPPAVA